MLWPYGMWLAFWCALGTIVGLTLINKLIERLGRPSILVFILMGILVLGAIATIIEESLKISHEIKENESVWEIKGICS